MNSPSALPIAVDAMGGDNAPRAVVHGAVLAAHSYGCDIALVGRRTQLERELSRVEGPSSAARARVHVVDATEVVEMGEHPAAAVRAKPDSSIVRCCQLVADGRACAVVSAGNSGASLAAGLFHLKRIRGVARPAIGGMLPSRTGHTFVLDVGANADAKAQWLQQFGVMGSIYAQVMMGLPTPRVGLLSNGAEPGKGSSLVVEAYPLLQRAGINFIGNVEGKDLFRGTVDVAVCDGFVGNIALKTAEGAGEFLFATLRDEAMSSLRGKAGGLLLKSKLRAIRNRVDYRHTGGALLLGVAGELVIAHGRSDELAIQNAVRVAREAVEQQVSEVITRAFAADGDTARVASQGVS